MVQSVGFGVKDRRFGEKVEGSGLSSRARTCVESSAEEGKRLRVALVQG